MPSALPGSYKPVPFWAAVVDKALSERGFWFEKRQYRAHVTLARRVITAGRCGATDPFKTTVSSFSLMLPERSGNSMVYTNVHTVNSCKNK